MPFLSKTGQPSTWFEKMMFGVILLILGFFAFWKMSPQLEIHDVFRSASQPVWQECLSQSGYREWLFLSSEKKALYDCVAKSKDSDFQKAAAIYMLKHGRIVFEDQPPSAN
jgi:hypothetical protein